MSMSFTDEEVTKFEEKERIAYVQGDVEKASLYALIADLTKENEDLKETIRELENE